MWAVGWGVAMPPRLSTHARALFAERAKRRSDGGAYTKSVRTVGVASSRRVEELLAASSCSSWLLSRCRPLKWLYPPYGSHGLCTHSPQPAVSEDAHIAMEGPFRMHPKVAVAFEASRIDDGVGFPVAVRSNRGLDATRTCRVCIASAAARVNKTSQAFHTPPAGCNSIWAWMRPSPGRTAAEPYFALPVCTCGRLPALQLPARTHTLGSPMLLLCTRTPERPSPARVSLRAPHSQQHRRQRTASASAPQGKP